MDGVFPRPLLCWKKPEETLRRQFEWRLGFNGIRILEDPGSYHDSIMIIAMESPGLEQPTMEISPHFALSVSVQLIETWRKVIQSKRNRIRSKTLEGDEEWQQPGPQQLSWPHSIQARIV
jgi:hypothetical protein